jgi:hypothetical protein
MLKNKKECRILYADAEGDLTTTIINTYTPEEAKAIFRLIHLIEPIEAYVVAPFVID